MSGHGPEPDGTRSVPLFPLPNVVLFPRAVLPLHIFEPRYIQMTDDALKGERLIAMALLKDGWEKNYYSRPSVEPVVCVGCIASWERLDDGKYNFLLQGLYRARLLKEEPVDLPYRIGQLQSLNETPTMEIDLSTERQHLEDLFQEDLCGMGQLDQQFRHLLASPMTTPDIADLMAFNFIEDVGIKQSLLEEPNVRLRVERTVEVIRHVRQNLKQMARRQNDRPSMN
ncbi:MAG: LON peptidase substrate-binding domain-containing protein [Phycisphaerales bacterium]|nr:LON peptidase substrate-binding domain-containing protein [Phycisphaerales bacterium]